MSDEWRQERTDRGVAGPRTSLAWSRTALSSVALSALVLRLGLATHSPVEIVAGGAAVMTALIIFAAARRQPRPVERLPILGVAVCISITALLTAASLIF